MNKKYHHPENLDPRCVKLNQLREHLKTGDLLLSSLMAELEGSAGSTQAHSAGVIVHVYWAGCAGLARLAAELPDAEGYRRSKRDVAMLRVDKIGSTSLTLKDRLRLLGSDEYGAWSYDAWGQPRKASGFRGWMAQAIHTTRGSIDEAVTVSTRSIDVRLPTGMSRRAFESRLQEELAAWSFSQQFPDLKRYTSYSFGSGSPVRGVASAEGSRVSEATELYAGLDPCRDGDRLLIIVESLLKAHRRFQGNSVGDRLPDPAGHRIEAAKRSSARAMSAAQLRAMRLRQKAQGTRRSGLHRRGPA